MKHVILLVLILLVNLYSYSQKNTFVSYEIALSNTQYSFSGREESNISTNVETGIPMGFITQEITKYFYIEAGYTTDYTVFHFPNSNSNDPGYNMFHRNGHQASLKTQFRLPLLKNKFNLYTQTGIAYSIARKETNLNKEVPPFIITDFYMQKDYFLGQLGIGFDFNCGKNLYIGLSYQRDFAFKDNVTIKGYTDDLVPFSIKHRAHASKIGFRIGYRISSLWNN